MDKNKASDQKDNLSLLVQAAEMMRKEDEDDEVAAALLPPRPSCPGPSTATLPLRQYVPRATYSSTFAPQHHHIIDLSGASNGRKRKTGESVFGPGLPVKLAVSVNSSPISLFRTLGCGGEVDQVSMTFHRGEEPRSHHVNNGHQRQGHNSGNNPNHQNTHDWKPHPNFPIPTLHPPPAASTGLNGYQQSVDRQSFPVAAAVPPRSMSVLDIRTPTLARPQSAFPTFQDISGNIVKPYHRDPENRPLNFSNMPFNNSFARRTTGALPTSFAPTMPAAPKSNTYPSGMPPPSRYLSSGVAGIPTQMPQTNLLPNGTANAFAWPAPTYSIQQQPSRFLESRPASAHPSTELRGTHRTSTSTNLNSFTYDRYVMAGRPGNSTPMPLNATTTIPLYGGGNSAAWSSFPGTAMPSHTYSSSTAWYNFDNSPGYRTMSGPTAAKQRALFPPPPHNSNYQQGPIPGSSLSTMNADPFSYNFQSRSAQSTPVYLPRQSVPYYGQSNPCNNGVGVSQMKLPPPPVPGGTHMSSSVQNQAAPAMTSQRDIPTASPSFPSQRFSPAPIMPLDKPMGTMRTPMKNEWGYVSGGKNFFPINHHLPSNPATMIEPTSSGHGQMPYYPPPPKKKPTGPAAHFDQAPIPPLLRSAYGNPQPNSGHPMYQPPRGLPPMPSLVPFPTSINPGPSQSARIPNSDRSILQTALLAPPLSSSAPLHPSFTSMTADESLGNDFWANYFSHSHRLQSRAEINMPSKNTPPPNVTITEKEAPPPPEILTKAPRLDQLQPRVGNLPDETTSAATISVGNNSDTAATPKPSTKINVSPETAEDVPGIPDFSAVDFNGNKTANTKSQFHNLSETMEELPTSSRHKSPDMPEASRQPKAIPEKAPSSRFTQLVNLLKKDVNVLNPKKLSEPMPSTSTTNTELGKKGNGERATKRKKTSPCKVGAEEEQEEGRQRETSPLAPRRNEQRDLEEAAQVPQLPPPLVEQIMQTAVPTSLVPVMSAEVLQEMTKNFVAAVVVHAEYLRDKAGDTGPLKTNHLREAMRMIRNGKSSLTSFTHRTR